MSMEDLMVLVDEADNKIGLMEKMETHRKGLLHKAFSGFVFDNKGRLLVQQRAEGKYHNPGIWANTVCSHPYDGESVTDGVRRRLGQELGFSEDFEYVDKFIYRAQFPNGLTEHEFDSVLVAHYGGAEVKPNPDEVQAIRWVTRAELEGEIAENPERFSYWLRQILKLGYVDKWFR